ncbi:optineurin isoform X2 [Zootermopsis nevadensis]|uniref:optineurin isoform X2 n=1 Tax=Zootermopsis nevadensis TaxID=136037 RepID=UPI000B8E751E|nr:optineurin isoform X2 [Zootermopsis nevadensis]
MVKVNESKQDDLHGHWPQSSLPSDDGSFVVLGRSPPQELNTQFTSNMSQQPTVCPAPPPHNSYPGSLPHLESQTLQNSSFVPGVPPTDLSPEEIQRKLHELLQENLKLKDTLCQNNLAMKQQFNTLVMWQNELLRVHKNHKEKFTETKELVLKLRAENAELKNILEAYKKAGSAVPSAAETELMMENAELKGKIAELQQKLSTPVPRKDQLYIAPSSKKEQELSALLEQVNRQLEIAERARRQLTVDVERVTAQRTRLERDMIAQKTEMEEQKEQLQKLQKEKQELEQKITLLMEQKLHDYVLIKHEEQQQGSLSPIGVQESNSQEIQSLVLQLEEQQTLVSTLTHQLKEERFKLAAALTAEKQTPSTVSDQASHTHDFSGCEEMLEHINSCLDEEAERSSDVDTWLQVESDSTNHCKGKRDAYMKIVNIFEAEVQELKNLVIQERASNEVWKKNLEEEEEKFRNLDSDYQKLVKELHSFHEEQKDKDRHNLAYYEVQARGFTEKIDGMTAQLLNKDEALLQKDKEMSQMKESMKKLELENEAITILKAQVEVYQSDFNAEREARENLAGEKERLAEDLRHLQCRNQQLLDELEMYQQTQFEQMQRQGVPSAPTVASGWNTIATPGRAKLQRPAGSSPGRISPGRPTAPQHQQQPLPPAEQNDRPFRVYDEEVPPPKHYSCPVCNMEFLQVDLLEYHVDTCLE